MDVDCFALAQGMVRNVIDKEVIGHGILKTFATKEGWFTVINYITQKGVYAIYKKQGPGSVNMTYFCV